jgi:drug/metabolite transporter (DMT)-like permease
MSLANYITPVVAVALGALIFGERLQPNAYLALVVILFGVAVSQRKARKPALGPPVTVAEKPQT